MPIVLAASELGIEAKRGLTFEESNTSGCCVWQRCHLDYGRTGIEELLTFVVEHKQ